MSTSSHVPPGFRFHPTDEELVDYYLRKKVASRRIDLDIIKDIDLYKIEPWDLQEKCRIGQDEQSEWYFFSHKDKKYPTGTRTNRATAVGFWKATGRDKPIYAKHNLVGMRKTLVFYKGRAPNGQKSDWIMHEYRLETSENGPPQEEGWVVCRVFKKRVPTTRKEIEQETPCWYDEEGPFIHDLNSPMRMVPQMHPMAFNQHLHPQRRELQLQYQLLNESFHQLPHLESPKLPNYINHGSNIQPTFISQDDIVQVQAGHQLQMIAVCNRNENADQSEDQVTDWRVLDKFVASQLSHDVSQEQDYTEPTDAFQVSEKQQEVVADYASASTSSSQIDHWN